jgi:hypothetical protein
VSTTPQQRDRHARAVAAIAHACGFDQPIAPLIVRQVPDVEILLRRDDATVRRVLQDPELRRSLREGVIAAFRDVWKRATLDRLQLDHPAWLRMWWLPVCTDAELDRLLAAPRPRSDHRRIGVARSAFPATVGAAEVLVDADDREVRGDYLVVERRVAAAVLDLAAEIAREQGRARPTTAARTATSGLEEPPAGIDDERATGWWHG